MNPNRLLELVAAPLACLFLILVLCVFAVQRPVSTGLPISTMRTRGQPLGNCEFNGFTIYLRADGKLAGGSREDVVSREVMLARVKEARDNVQE